MWFDKACTAAPKPSKKSCYRKYITVQLEYLKACSACVSEREIVNSTSEMSPHASNTSGHMYTEGAEGGTGHSKYFHAYFFHIIALRDLYSWARHTERLPVFIDIQIPLLQLGKPSICLMMVMMVDAVMNVLTYTLGGGIKSRES